MSKILELPRATIEDAASVLRSIADEIEAGKYGRVRAAVVILDADRIEMFGSGDANQYKATWMIEACKAKLLP